MGSSYLWFHFPPSDGRGGDDGESETSTKDRNRILCIPSVQKACVCLLLHWNVLHRLRNLLPTVLPPKLRIDPWIFSQYDILFSIGFECRFIFWAYPPWDGGRLVGALQHHDCNLIPIRRINLREYCRKEHREYSRCRSAVWIHIRQRAQLAGCLCTSTFG